MMDLCLQESCCQLFITSMLAGLWPTYSSSACRLVSIWLILSTVLPAVISITDYQQLASSLSPTLSGWAVAVSRSDGGSSTCPPPASCAWNEGLLHSVVVTANRALMRMRSLG